MNPRRDRHGRLQRGDHDLRHRPADGFRTASASRFDTLVRTALGHLPSDIAAYLTEVVIEVSDIPGTPELLRAELDGDMPLAKVVLPPTGPSRLEVYRRPLELRSASREDLVVNLRQAIRNAVLDAIGGPPED